MGWHPCFQMTSRSRDLGCPFSPSAFASTDFSLRSCRSSSMIFSRVLARKFCGMFGGNFAGFFFADSQMKAQLATLPAIYGSLEALRAENRKKVSKKSSRAFRPGVSKKSRKGRKVSEKCSKSVILGTFRPFRDFFETPGRKAREDFLETFLRFSARRASRLP